MANITIRVREKHAESDFCDLISFNENSYRLKFDFDSEWTNYPQRVAVVLWAGGCREQLFTGDECDMPAVSSPECDTALVGVYSSDGNGKRIASSFVRFRVLAGAHAEPDETPPASLHEQILDFLNDFDFSLLTQKVTPGSYSSVDVNAYGFVTGGKHIIEVGVAGQTQPSSTLADGGLFFRKEESGYTLCYFDGTTLTAITGIAGGSGGAVTSVNGETGDVIVSKFDLGLADVALTGSYDDLVDKPAAAAVTSVNGETGDVIVSKFDLGLADVALTGSYDDLVDKPAAAAVTSVNGETGDVIVSKFDLGLADVALTGSYNDLIDKPTSTGESAVTSVNGETGDVIVSKFDLGLADVALSGSYNDLVDKPAAAAVTSVNGETGDVFVTKFDLGLADVALTGSYDDLVDKPAAAAVTSVNGETGDVFVTKFDLGLADVALSGSYDDLLNKPTIPDAAAVTSVNGETGDVFVTKFDLGLADVALTGSYNDLIDKPTSVGGSAVTSVNGETGDVIVSKFDLGLATVALTGSYNDLIDKPTFGESTSSVTSVNGLTGDVTVSKFDLGIDHVLNERQFAIASSEMAGVDFDTLSDTGCYFVSGTSSQPCTNAPTSSSNTASDCRWLLMTFSHADEGEYVTQLAISEKSDCAIRIRNYSSGSWGAWKTVI